MSTWLISGCSTGSAGPAKAVFGAGHNAAVTARYVTRVVDLSDAAPGGCLPSPLMFAPAHVTFAVRQAEQRFAPVSLF